MAASSLLHRLRQDAGLSRAELAKRSGVSAGTIGHIERGGDCRPPTLRKLATALGVKTSALTAEDQTGRLSPAALEQIRQVIAAELDARGLTAYPAADR